MSFLENQTYGLQAREQGFPKLCPTLSESQYRAISWACNEAGNLGGRIVAIVPRILLSVYVTLQSLIPSNNIPSSLLLPQSFWIDWVSQQQLQSIYRLWAQIFRVYSSRFNYFCCINFGNRKGRRRCESGQQRINCHRNIKREYCPIQSFGDQKYLSLSNWAIRTRVSLSNKRQTIIINKNHCRIISNEWSFFHTVL